MRPLLYHKLDDNDDVKPQFDELMVYISYGIIDEEEDAAAFNNRILRHEVPAKPRSVSQDLHWSLLMTACSGLDQEWSHPAIKFLIRMNPTALLWRRDDDGLRDTRARDDWPTYKIARHPSHCLLMAWIAETYPWVLDKHCVFGLIQHFFEAWHMDLS